MSNKNMILWDQVQTSDPDSIKEVSFGRKFNAINAQHQIKRATEVFGPIGKGWGIYDEDFLFNIPGIVIYKATMWWREEDEVWSFPVSASIVTHSNQGKVDDEFIKKVATDAMTKGFSKLGFNADIFLGLWDDNRYVNSVKESKKKEAVKPAETVNAPSEDDIKKEVTAMKRKANTLMKHADPDGIRKLWNDNKHLHSVEGLQSAIVKYGKQAKENQDQNKEANDAEGEAQG